MKTLTRALLGLLPLLALTLPAAAQEENACVAPGVTIDTDPEGDNTGDHDFSDLLSFSGAEPADRPGQIVFTLKMRGLSETPPGLRWIARFTLPTSPPNGDEDWFLGMTTEEGTPRYVYGTTGVQPSGAPAGARLFSILGDLAEGSGHDADGTITLILDKAVIGNPAAGTVIVPVDEFVRTPVTPGNQGILDQGSGAGFYEIRGSSACGSGKSGLAAIVGGAFAPSVLLGLWGLAALRRQFRRPSPLQGEGRGRG